MVAPTGTYDVIIIGAGVGGLTCGALLAKHGLSVLVAEQHTKVGGYCTGYRRRGFTFDVPHVFTGWREGSRIRGIISHIGADRYVDAVELEKTFILWFPDRRVQCYADRRRYEAQLIEHFPEERKGIRRFFADTAQVWRRPAEQGVVSQPIPFRRYLSRYIADERLMEVLCSGWWWYSGLSPERVDTLSILNMIHSFDAWGAWRPKGGFQNLADALARCVTEAGGHVSTGRRISEILTDCREVRGVVFEDGEQVLSHKVVSNADSKRTFLDLLPRRATPPSLTHKVRGFRMSPSCVSVHLGLGIDLPHTLACGCVLVCPRYGLTEESFRLHDAGQMQMDPSLLQVGISFPSLSDATLATPGEQVVDLTHFPVPYVWRNVWQSRNQEAYTGLKAEVAQALVRAATRALPELSTSPVVQDVASPLTYQRYTGATNGAIYDVACTPDQSSIRRLPTTTPVPGLYVTGAKTMYGSGIAPAIYSGFATADTVLGGQLTEAKVADGF